MPFPRQGSWYLFRIPRANVGTPCMMKVAVGSLHDAPGWVTLRPSLTASSLSSYRHSSCAPLPTLFSVHSLIWSLLFSGCLLAFFLLPLRSNVLFEAYHVFIRHHHHHHNWLRIRCKPIFTSKICSDHLFLGLSVYFFYDAISINRLAKYWPILSVCDSLCSLHCRILSFKLRNSSSSTRPPKQ
jgi:hypothetical protein